MSRLKEFTTQTARPLPVVLLADVSGSMGTDGKIQALNHATPLHGQGSHRLRVRFPRLALLSGEYLWNVYTLDDTGLQVLDMAELVQPFTVLNEKHREFGLVWLDHEWLSLE